VIRAFSHRCEAADAPAERFAAKFFPCGKFDFARLLVRVRKSRRDQSRACACNAIVLSDLSQTRIPRALLHYLEFLEEVCVSAKNFPRHMLMRSAMPMRRLGANGSLYTKLGGNAVFFSVLV
jgi:hypothetical protein